MKGRYREMFEYLGLIVQIGLSMVVSILLGFYGGQWIDGRLDTGLTFTLIGLVLGIGAGFRSAYETAKRALESSSRKDKGQ